MTRSRQTPSPTLPGHLIDRLLPWVAALSALIIYHRFSIASGLDLVQADTGDSRFVDFMLEHWKAVLDGRVPWRSPLIFFPIKGTLGYSDALLVMGAAHALLRHVGLGVFTAMNLQLILWSALAFAAAYAFLRRGFGLGRPACCLGALFFAFGWPRFAQLVHPQLQLTAPLPLMALLALRFLRDGTTLTRGHALRILAGLALLTALLLATTTYYALFFALGLTIAFLLCLARRGSRHHVGRVLRRHAPPLAALTMLLAILLIPVARTYWPIIRQSAGRPWAEVAGFLVDPLDLVWMGRENFVWGWLSADFPVRADHNRAEGRIGVGLVTTAIWLLAIVWAIRCLMCRARPGAAAPATRDRVAALVILTGALLQISMLRLSDDLSPWWLIYQLFPGMRGVRAIGRLQLVVMLPMALAIAVMTERLSSAARAHRWLRLPLIVLVGLAAAEQCGSVEVYSGRQAETLARRVAAAIPAACRAFYAFEPPDVSPPSPVITSETAFDAQAYLRANPDVARNWGGTPWEHYDRFGRREHRFLDPAVARRYLLLNFFYNYTVPLAATLAGRPAVNGLSGWEPPGYDLGDVLTPDAPARLQRWLARMGVPSVGVCAVPIPITSSDLPQRTGQLF